VNKAFSLALTTFLSLTLMPTPKAWANSGSDPQGLHPDYSAPRDNGAYQSPQAVPAHSMELKNVPDFASDGVYQPNRSGNQGGAFLRADAASTTLPVSTRLKLVVEVPIDARTSEVGELFEAHVKDDLFIGQSLLLPRGSLVRGRVVEITRPRLISRAAKIGLKLDQIVTPTGEVIPLDAALEFQKGVSNRAGELDPGTNFGTRVGGDVKTVTGMNSTGTTRGALIAANVATLGAPAVATLIGSSAVALFRSGDNVSLVPGDVLEVLLTNDLGLQLN
jgi:hypothetical protein